MESGSTLRTAVQRGTYNTWLLAAFGCLVLLAAPAGRAAQCLVCQTGDPDPECDFYLIQDGIDAMGPGDTVLVRWSSVYPPLPSYRESIVVPPEKGNLIIKREAPGTYPVIEALPGQPGAFLQFVGTFSGFEVTRDSQDRLGEQGIVLGGPCQIKDCKINCQSAGISAPCVSNATNDNPPTITQCDIYDNGLGVASGETEQIFSYNRIHDNDEHGAHLTVGSCARLTNNLIFDNGGHGVFIDTDPHNLTLAEISNNNIRDNGGDGIYIEYVLEPEPWKPAVPMIRDNIIVWNAGYGVECNMTEGCYPTLRYNDVWNNSLGSYRNCPDGNSSRIIKSISVDPKLVGDDFLGPRSLCIDAGSLSLQPGSTREAGTPDQLWLDMGWHHIFLGSQPPGGLTALPDGRGGLLVSWAAPEMNADYTPLDGVACYGVKCRSSAGEVVAERFVPRTWWRLARAADLDIASVEVHAVDSNGVAGEPAVCSPAWN